MVPITNIRDRWFKLWLTPNANTFCELCATLIG